MAFLDNSGDIILDAVLTDTGRLRLAQGDGSFKISKFALGDDEINYGLYNKSHSSGSAYYDLEILQTPILEAFTNNTSNLKTKLVSLSRTNILYMPVLKLNENAEASNPGQEASSNRFNRRGDGNTDAASPGISDTKFYVAVDKFTMDALSFYRDDDKTANKPLSDNSGFLRGVIQGYNVGAGGTIRRDLIRVDQGLDTEEIAPETGLDSDLRESAYIIEMDYRLGRVKQIMNDQTANVNFIDDDNVASYYLTDSSFVNPKGNNQAPELASAPDGSQHINDLRSVFNPQVFRGPRGTTLQFRLQASQDLQSSTYLFNQLGSSQAANADENIGGFSTGTTDDLVVNKTIYYIDSTVRVIGANTGYRLDIPVRYVKIAD